MPNLATRNFGVIYPSQQGKSWTKMANLATLKFCRNLPLGSNAMQQTIGGDTGTGTDRSKRHWAGINTNPAPGTGLV